MKRTPLEGRVIGKWSILNYVGCDGKKSWYRCQCTGCGAIKSVRADKLVSGRSTQCTSCRLRRTKRKKKC